MSSTSATAARSSRAGTRRLRCDPTLCIALLTLLGGCRESAPPITRALAREPAPEASAPGEVCADIAETRVCWRGETPVVVPRTLPEPSRPAPPQGWRCGGDGRERTCEDRARNGGAFDCGTQRCLQAHPRMPDDGEWECVEISGVVYCHSRGEAAGMQAGPSDLGWLCGPRHGGAAGERVCVDLDADRPPASARAGGEQQCRFEARFGAPQRSCTPARGVQLGSACTAASVCPEGTHCLEDLCLPERPEPSCFFDRDCGANRRCVLGSCRGA